jgi:hypothetical protein
MDERVYPFRCGSGRSNRDGTVLITMIIMHVMKMALYQSRPFGNQTWMLHAPAYQR